MKIAIHQYLFGLSHKYHFVLKLDVTILNFSFIFCVCNKSVSFSNDKIKIYVSLTKF